MQKRIGIISLLIIPLIVIAMKNSWGKTTPLIPRQIIFGNPEKMDPQISPDGKHIAYLAPLTKNDENEVLNIWVKSIDKNDDKPLTSFTDRSSQSFFWSHDSTQILYIKDNQGDENWRLYGITLDTKEITCYTPFEKTQARLIDHKKRSNPSLLVIGLNKDNPALHDAYSLDLKTKKIELLCKNPGGVVQWVVDKKCKVLAAVQDSKAGERQVVVLKNDKWHPIRTYSCEDTQNNCLMAGFSEKENTISMLESKEYTTARLVTIDCATGETTVRAQDPYYDMTDVSINPDTEEIEAVLCDREKPEWIILKQDSAMAKVLEAFKGKGNKGILSHDDSQTLWTVMTGKDTSTATYYLYNSKDNTTTELFKARPQLPEAALSPMEPITYKSRDGLTIHGYLTCPRGAERTQLPMVVYVHGGPNRRDSWGYNNCVQWLANRGYAVLQINYRGSMGYGKDFINAANKEWGGKMHDDLIDGVNWAIAAGIADKNKIAIFGGSYGGYAALVGAAFTPDVFCCAVDSVGPSNLVSFLKTIPPYWEVYRAQINRSIGNPDTEEEFLKSRSPLYKADAIKIPLLIAQGAHDPRVKQAESEQIVEALKKHGIPHEYLLFPDEGHGFVNACNRLKFYARAEAFLARYLGGRCEA